MKNSEKSIGMCLLSDQMRGGVTSCKCMGWSVADCRQAAVSPDTMQHSPPWILRRWMSLLFSAYKKKHQNCKTKLRHK